MEIMIETTQSIINSKGEVTPRKIANAANEDSEQNRCIGAHFGTYDYSASCDLIAAYQKMDSTVWVLFSTLRTARVDTFQPISLFRNNNWRAYARCGSGLPNRVAI